MTVNDFKETTCATAGHEDMDADALIQPPQAADSENLLGRVLAGMGPISAPIDISHVTNLSLSV